MADDEMLDVVIVGAGPAGLGCGLALDRLRMTNFTILERHEIGASLARWPREMRFITPSFNSNAFGQVDLNAIAPDTSPAFTLDVERLSGPAYAKYLREVAKQYELPVDTGIDVLEVCPLAEDGKDGFRVETSRGTVFTRFVIWAAGEFQYPDLNPFPGAQLCRHSSSIKSWREIEGEEVVVIGGSESAIDAAVTLIACGKKVRVLAETATWNLTHEDPSRALSPYTHQRLRRAVRGELDLHADCRVVQVQPSESGYEVFTEQGPWHTATPPILATGFSGSFKMLGALVNLREDGFPLLNELDESTVAPGLFLSGPMVRHDQVVLCFIYKFRQRFAVIAQAIGERLGLDLEPLEAYRQHHMYLDDLSCCGESCVC